MPVSVLILVIIGAWTVSCKIMKLISKLEGK